MIVQRVATLAQAWELAVFSIANERAVPRRFDDLDIVMMALWPEEWHVC